MEKLQVNLPVSTSGTAVTTVNDQAREWLIAQPSPEAVDAALSAWVSTSLGATISLTSEWRFPEGKPHYRVATAANVGVRTAEDAAKALAKYQTAMAPATAKQVETWYYALWLATVGAQAGNVDKVAKMKLYSAELARYPADVVKATFEHFVRIPRPDTAWFPTLPEMLSEAERLVSSRKSVIAALSHWRPVDTEDQRRAKARDLMFEAAEVEASVALKRRSDPEAHAAAMARAAELRSQAKTLRQGGEIT